MSDVALTWHQFRLERRMFWRNPTALLHQLTSAALARGAQVRDLSVTRPTLEDVYLELTAEAGEEAVSG